MFSPRIPYIFLQVLSDIYNSAGIGRTGTYIALDALYENGQETGFVDVKEFTEMMRQNRMNMIQTVVSFVSWMNHCSGEMLLENS